MINVQRSKRFNDAETKLYERHERQDRHIVTAEMVSMYHECLHGDCVHNESLNGNCPRSRRAHHTHNECARQVHTRQDHEHTNRYLPYHFPQGLAAIGISVEENLRAARACSLC